MNINHNTLKDFLFLNELNSSEYGIITNIKANDEEFKRLKSMGLCKGRGVEVVKKGDPLIVRVYGTRIGISSRLADKIEIQKCKKTS